MKLGFWDLGSTYCLVGDDQLDHRQRIKHSDGDDVPKQAERTGNSCFQINNESLLNFLKKNPSTS